MLKQVIDSTYKTRRERLMSIASDACFVFFGASEVIRSNDTHFSFKQNTDFFYLTEFDEPNAALILCEGKSHLFVMDRNPDSEIWDGERYGVERAKQVFQVDEAHSFRDFDVKFEELIQKSKRIFYSLGHDSRQDERILRLLARAKKFQGKGSFGNLPVYDPMGSLANLRVVKDELEVERIKKACSFTAKAHLQVLKRAKAGMLEFDVQAEFQYQVSKLGCTDLGYPSIVASGYNATTLHYVRNNETLKHGDLLLIDAGGEYQGYTGDLTQTFPVSGKFSPEQKRVYEKVLGVNREVQKMVKPGTNYRALHTRSVELLTDALLSLGVLEGDLEANIKAHSYRKYFPHGLGHYLGLDVHDAGIYHEHGQDFELRAGMVITNEPGLYFRERGNPYFGIGVRIEDDLLVTEDDAYVLTHELPREVDAIENLRSIANG